MHIVLTQPQLRQLIQRAVHHIGRSTGKHLNLAQVGEIFMNHFINPAGAAIPVIGVLFNDGVIMKVRIIPEPLLWQVTEIKPDRRAIRPLQVNLLLWVDGQSAFN